MRIIRTEPVEGVSDRRPGRGGSKAEKAEILGYLRTVPELEADVFEELDEEHAGRLLVDTVSPQHQRERVVELAGTPDQAVVVRVVMERLPPRGGTRVLPTACDARCRSSTRSWNS